MTRAGLFTSIAAFALSLALLVPSAAHATRRIALLVGANDGWAQDQPLRHAEEDAERLASALLELGDFKREDVRVLDSPSTEELRAKLDGLLAKKPSPGEDTLFLFYYSGHADGQHLHLRGAPLGFEELYDRLRALPFTVKLGVLDACQSGSILVAKGGRPTSTFEVKLQDDLDVRGTAFLTSSGADELSQEARALGGSVFTHHFVSGLRGAADEDGDGRVSLQEIYRYASVRTTLDTAATRAGAQRPSFLFDLKGRGEIFLTHLDGPSGVLSFPPARRCFVTDMAERRLIAEVAPEEAKAAQLALPVGTYVLKCVADARYDVVAVNTTSGGRVDVASLHFGSQPLSNGVIKGHAPIGSGTDAVDPDDPNGLLKRRGFQQLRDDQPDEALATFEDVLRKDLRDPEAFRGKAQAYLALADRAGTKNQNAEQKRLIQLALRTDPRLNEDPRFRGLAETTGGAATQRTELEKQRENAELIDSNLRHGHPRQYQGLGVGLSLFDAHGLFPISVDYLVKPWLQPSLKLTFFSPGVGLQLRAVPMDGMWSPFVGVGGHVTVAGLGLTQRSAGGRGYTFNGYEYAAADQFDRAVYVDGGVQLALPHWQADLGVTVMLSAPPDRAAFVGVLPVLSVKYFFDRPDVPNLVN